MRKVILSLMVAVSVTGCTIHESLSTTYRVNARDLVQQSLTGNGERLAKPVPNRPVLVNNSLVFSVPGNAVLGIAMSVGAIKSSVEALSGMEAFDLVALLEAELDQLPDVPTTLEPYCYLHGHPKAYVESRIYVVTEADAQTLSKRSELKPIEGEGSWAENGGRSLIEVCSAGIVELATQLRE